ncbi:MAG: hypothetical protein JWM28_4439 [Chitinophagaceae bacterium]|nr:hypothetical protein [Chitinophagaceae bacterium]
MLISFFVVLLMHVEGLIHEYSQPTDIAALI